MNKEAESEVAGHFYKLGIAKAIDDIVGSPVQVLKGRLLKDKASKYEKLFDGVGVRNPEGEVQALNKVWKFINHFMSPSRLDHLELAEQIRKARNAQIATTIGASALSGVAGVAGASLLHE